MDDAQLNDLVCRIAALPPDRQEALLRFLETLEASPQADPLHESQGDATAMSASVSIGHAVTEPDGTVVGWSHTEGEAISTGFSTSTETHRGKAE